MKLIESFRFDFNQKRVLVTGAGKGIGEKSRRCCTGSMPKVCFLLTEGAAMLNSLALRIDGGFLVT